MNPSSLLLFFWFSIFRLIRNEPNGDSELLFYFIHSVSSSLGLLNCFSALFQPCSVQLFVDSFISSLGVSITLRFIYYTWSMNSVIYFPTLMNIFVIILTLLFISYISISIWYYKLHYGYTSLFSFQTGYFIKSPHFLYEQIRKVIYSLCNHCES